MTKRIASIGVPEWPLDALNVFGFGDRGAESVGGTKQAYELVVVGERVLPWKRESLWTNPECQENLSIVVETVKSILY